MASFGDIWVSERHVRRASICWRLERAALLFSRSLHRRSVEFHAPNDSDVAWTVFLQSSACSAQNNLLELPKKVNVRLRYFSKYNPSLFMRPFICPKDQTTIEATLETDDYKFFLEKQRIYSISRGSKVVVALEQIDPELEYLDIKLTVVYMGRLAKPRRVSAPARTLGQPPVGIAADFERLLDPESDIPTDVTIHVEGKEIRAHRAILSVRSPVFQAMFRSNMIEAQTGQVSLCDMKAEVCSAMLQYIYTGRVCPVTCSIPELLAAADRFVMKGLKDACEGELIAGLSVETAYESLCILKKYNCPKLRNKTLNIIRTSILEAIRMPWWDEMLTNDPYILLDIIGSNRDTMHACTP